MTIVSAALAGLRANEARYFKNKYDHDFNFLNNYHVNNNEYIDKYDHDDHDNINYNNDPVLQPSNRKIRLDSLLL